MRTGSGYHTMRKSAEGRSSDGSVCGCRRVVVGKVMLQERMSSVELRRGVTTCFRAAIEDVASMNKTLTVCLSSIVGISWVAAVYDFKVPCFSDVIWQINNTLAIRYWYRHQASALPRMLLPIFIMWCLSGVCTDCL